MSSTKHLGFNSYSHTKMATIVLFYLHAYSRLLPWLTRENHFCLILKLNDHKLHYVGMSVCGAGGVWVAKGLQSNLELLHILIVE